MTAATHHAAFEWTTWQARRTARAADRRLRDEVRSYRTPAEREELLEILARHPDEDAAPMRRLLG